MRKDHLLIALAGTLCSTAMLPAGCIDYLEEAYTPLTDPKLATSGSGGTGGTGGTGGHGGGTPKGCIPNENVDAVDDACGVFVSSSLGDDGNAGTKEKPLKSIGVALTKGRPVYACGEGFAESVSIAESATLYGALDCSKGWVYDAAKKTQLTAGADAIPLTVTKATTSAEVLDFAVTSANATQSSGSSIAVLVAQAAVSFTRCDVVAGDGRSGKAGTPYTQAAQIGAEGLPGGDACSANSIIGADGVTSTCGGGESTSGLGGNGTTNSGGNGSDGLPGTTLNAGKGESAGLCADGTAGDSGAPGNPGLGATGIGSIAAGGYTGTSGGDAGPGAVAQGGGGGGGAKGGAGAGKCPAGMTGGASGGSGGSGGCGGLGGKGGAFGGASFALVSVAATLSFTSVTLKPGKGGDGGNGGNGQNGGDGGPPGAGGKAKPTFTNLNDACSGGDGGKGGLGGKGGGGLGGHAVALASTGKAPPPSGWTATSGTPGSGGTGDNANGNVGDGAAGTAADCWDFDVNTACK